MLKLMDIPVKTKNQDEMDAHIAAMNNSIRDGRRWYVVRHSVVGSFRYIAHPYLLEIGEFFVASYMNGERDEMITLTI